MTMSRGPAFRPYPEGFPHTVDEMREGLRAFVADETNRERFPVTHEFWTKVIAAVDAGETWQEARVRVSGERDWVADMTNEAR